MRGLFAVIGLAPLLLVTSNALAFCRTTVCAQKNPPPECLPLPPEGTCQTAGNPLFWPKSCVSFSVQVDGSPKLGITADTLESVVRGCFDTWQAANCSLGGTPNISVETFPQVECSEVRYNTKAKNQNLLTFRDTKWPHDDPTNSQIALTSVTFDKETGQIYDVDMEFNSWYFNLTLETSSGGTDLQSVIQHETGHFLGLAHSDVADSTMYFSYAGSSAMRTLEADDVLGICSVYPPTSNPDTGCDPTPRHGFSTKCNSPNSDGCSLVRLGDASPKSGWVLLGLCAATLLRRRRCV